MSKYTKADREEAIEACALMASSDASIWFSDTIDIDAPAAELAHSAFYEASSIMTTREQWAEAECMLREGWNP